MDRLIPTSEHPSFKKESHLMADNKFPKVSKKARKGSRRASGSTGGYMGAVRNHGTEALAIGVPLALASTAKGYYGDRMNWFAKTETDAAGVTSKKGGVDARLIVGAVGLVASMWNPRSPSTVKKYTGKASLGILGSWLASKSTHYGVTMTNATPSSAGFDGIEGVESGRLGDGSHRLAHLQKQIAHLKAKRNRIAGRAGHGGQHRQIGARPGYVTVPVSAVRPGFLQHAINT